MKSKLITFFALFAILFGCAMCQEEEASTIQLHVFGSSSKWWLAVDPRNERYETVSVEVREAGSLNWVQAESNPAWGYFQLPSPSGRGFRTPLTFRFTAANGERVISGAFLNAITPNTLVNTAVQYNKFDREPTAVPTYAPTQAPVEVVPTAAPIVTEAPTQAPTEAPTQPPTQAPTQPPVVDLCTVTTPKSEPVKILVPLYVYPGAAWDQLVSVAQSGVPIIAIINPNNGPLPAGPDAAYTTYIKKLRDAGVEVVGYVHTLWGARAMSTVTAEIDLYANKYPGVDGIFFDEGATEAAHIPYYATAYRHVLSKNFHHSILNPGVQPAQGYVDISTNIVIFENYASQLGSTSYSSWVTCAPNAAAKAGWKYKFSSIVHTASLADMPWLIAQSHAKGMGIVYITDGEGGCCTYNHLANYFLQHGSAVKALNA